MINNNMHYHNIIAIYIYARYRTVSCRLYMQLLYKLYHVTTEAGRRPMTSQLHYEHVSITHIGSSVHSKASTCSTGIYRAILNVQLRYRHS